MKKILQGTKALAIVLLLMMTATMVNAQKTAVADGSWNAPATWSPAGVPASTDDIIINNGVDVTVPSSVTCNSITFGSANGSVNVSSGFTLTVTTSITLQNSNTANTAASLLGAGTISCASIQIGGNATLPTADRTTTLTSSVTNLNVSGNLTIRSEDNSGSQGNARFVFSSGTVTVGGTIILDADSDGGSEPTSELDMNGGGAETGTLNISGATPFSTPGAGNVVIDFAGTDATVNYTGTAQAVLAATYTNLSISGSDTKTISAATTVDLELNLLSGTLAAGTNLTMGATGTPIINRSGGSLTGTLQGGNDYDVVYTGSSKTTGAELSGTGFADITINLTTGETLTLDANRAPDGNVTIAEGIFDIGTFTFNRSSGGGTFSINDGGWLRIGGTNTYPTNYTTSTFGNTDATVEYSGTAQSVAAIAGDSYTNVVLSGSGVKTFAAETINGKLSIQGTATVAGVSGTAPAYGGSASVEYKGSAAQVTSNIEFPAAMGADVIIDNPSGVTLNGAKTLSGFLTLTNGILTTTATNLLIMPDNFATVNGGSTASYIDGPVRKVGNNAYTFKVGRGGVYSPVTITAPDDNADAFTCEYKRESATALGPITVAGIFRVSNCEYWELTETADAGAANSISVTVGWYSNSGCGNWDYISDYTGLRLVHFNGVSWDALAGAAGNPVGDNTTGTITRTAVTTFSPFALGSAIDDGNALPVNFSDVKAFEKGTGVQIEWTNLTEKDLVNYVVERSANGRDFTAIAQVAPRSNQADKESYTSFDASPMAGANFYRIKVLEIDGKVIYSKLLKVDIGRITKGISLYPNPVAGKEVTVGFSAIKGQYTLRIINAAGQEVFTQRLSHPGGNISQAVILPSSVRSGIYNMLITGDNYKESKMFVVQ